MGISLGMVVGGLVVAAVAVAPSVMIMKNGKLFRKIHFLVGVVMLLGGMGLIALTAWLVNIGRSWGLTVWIGVPAVIALILVAIAVLIGISDWEIGRPEQWGLFALPALVTAVIMTSGPTWDYISSHFSSNAETLKAQVERSR